MFIYIKLINNELQTMTVVVEVITILLQVDKLLSVIFVTIQLQKSKQTNST